MVQVSSMFITSIVGAGFATGQEIYKFFTSYGFSSFYGVLLATVIFCAMGCAVLVKARREKISSLDDLLVPRVGNLPAKIIRFIMAVFQFVVFVIMQSGLKSLLEKAGLPGILANVIVVVILIYIISSGINRVMLVNSVLAPAIIIGIVSLSIALILLKGYGFSERPVFAQNLTYSYNPPTLFGLPESNWMLAAVLYVSFNTLLCLPALTDAGKILETQSQAMAGGILGGILIGLMAFSSNFVLYIYNSVVEGLEMPLVSLAFSLGKFMGIVYSSVIAFSMLCSASICGYFTVNRLVFRLSFNRFFSAILLTLVCIPLSSMNFASLIGMFYPAFGVAGLFLLLILLFK